MTKKSYDDVMDILYDVLGVTEHLNKFSVLMVEQIVKRCYELGLTQNEVVEIIKNNGEKITQASLSKIESGDDNIKADSYDKVLRALGGLEDITPHFKKYQKDKTVTT